MAKSARPGPFPPPSGLAGGCLSVALAAAATPAVGQQEVLERYVGSWDIHATTLQPERSTSTYSEEYRWTLDGKYIEGRTGRKADGTWDMIYGTYDPNSGGYPFWVFSSSGSYTYIPPGRWDNRRAVMTWDSPQEWDIRFTSRCHFPDRDLRECALLIKDWKGKVILELEWRAVRRAD